MNLFTINHSSGGGANPCDCEKQRGYIARNQINLDVLTEVRWEDGMWIVDFGDHMYRIHDEEKMKALETALPKIVELKPDPDEDEVA